MRANVVRVILQRGRANRFVRVLRIGLGAIVVRLLGHVVSAVALPDELADLRERLIGYTRRIGSHVGDQADGALTGQLDPLVELLRDHHRLLDGEARSLLQLARNERRNRALLALFRRHRADDPLCRLQIGEHFVGFCLVANLDVGAVALEETGVELWRHGASEPRRHVPVLFRNEGEDLPLAIAHELQRDRLHAAGAQSAANLVPEQRADLVADQTIEHATRLLGVDHLLVDRRRLVERRQHALLRDLVEHQAADLLAVTAAELFRQVPSNRLPFAIGVGRHKDLGRVLRSVLQFLEDLLATRDDFVRRLESILDVHTELAFGQIADVAHRGDDLVVLAEIFIDRLRLCGRFDHHQCLGHNQPN